MNRKYSVKLSNEEKIKIREILNGTTTPKTLRNRCNILLMADESVGKPPIREQIAARCGVSDVTVYKTIKEYETQGLKICLKRRIHKTPPNPPIVTGEIEARIIALACTAAPKGYARWTVRLLRDKVIELKIVDSIGRETIRTTLKKHNLNLI